MFKKSILLSSTLAFILNANTLEVYQNFTKYSYEPESKYIGFVKNIKATCKDENIPLEYALECKEENLLCKEFNNLKEKNRALKELKLNLQTIDTLLSKKEKEALDANKLIENAKIIAKEKSKLFTDSQKLKEQIAIKTEKLNSITTANKPLYLSKECNEKVELTLPYGYVNFKPIYEATIDDDIVKIVQKIEVTNKSGIDINAKVAKFYFYPLNEYVPIIEFSPWIAREFKSILKKSYKRKEVAQGYSLGYDAEPNVEPVEPAVAEMKEIPIGSYNDAREYSVKNINLPSSQKPLKVDILEYKTNIECKLKTYPFISQRVFKACSFKPKYQIDSNNWIVKVDDKIINKSAEGRYIKDKYSIYTEVDKDILIKRKRVVSKEKESGIFGGVKKQKDGYKLTIINKSNKNKKIEVIERIPTSSSDKIKIKLLHVKPKIDYKLLRDGKIVLNLELKPNETKEIEILFELSYDKELKVKY